ncbi:MAG TPA: glycosyltransferase family 1 protein [Actinobacteria bacterium]|nr:glycosyltransferase family 1 protein [Actinomycetota bacterium]
MPEFLRPRRRRAPRPDPPRLSFGSWERLPDDADVVAICHPRWRGVRRATYSFEVPVVEAADLDPWGPEIVERLRDHGVDRVVVSGFPPGAARFAAAARRAGLRVGILLHSSPTQHGAEDGEAAVVAEALRLVDDGVADRLGFAKEGVAEMFAALGRSVAWVPNRPPKVPVVTRRELGSGLHVGVFAEPFWRKNVVPQLGAVAILGGVAHVMRAPTVGYLEPLEVVEHGELPWEAFVALQGSVDLNLYVTLSECFPLTPMESYRLGVPCLASRTSAIFRSDPELWRLTTVDELDNPRAIAAAADALLAEAETAITRANRWMDEFDADAAARWRRFVE